MKQSSGRKKIIFFNVYVECVKKFAQIPIRIHRINSVVKSYLSEIRKNLCIQRTMIIHTKFYLYLFFFNRENEMFIQLQVHFLESSIWQSNQSANSDAPVRNETGVPTFFFFSFFNSLIPLSFRSLSHCKK